MPRNEYPPLLPTGPLTARQVGATYEALRRGDSDGLTLVQFLCFARFPKWTAACYAEHWEVSEDTASHDLKALQRLGVIACLQGRGHGAGGREPDLWFLTRLGARVLTRHLAPRTSIKAPKVVADGDTALRTAGGIPKYRVPAKPAQNAHDLNCLRLGVAFGWLHDDSGWEVRKALTYLDGEGWECTLVPDFARRWEEQLEGRRAAFLGSEVVEHLRCVEVEGTEEGAHVRQKHRGYAALARSLERCDQPGRAFRLHVTLVFTFPPSAARQQRQVLQRHERAFAQEPDAWRYGLSWTTLDQALALPEGQPFSASCTKLNRQQIRERERALAERIADAYTGW